MTELEAPPAERHPTAAEWQELRQILWTMGKMLGGQTVILEELSQRLPTLPYSEQVRMMAQDTEAIRRLMEQDRAETAAIRVLLEQAGRKNERRFSLYLPHISLPRPSPAWFFLLLSLAALWALWYGWAALWSTLSPLFM